MTTRPSRMSPSSPPRRLRVSSETAMPRRTCAGRSLRTCAGTSESISRWPTAPAMSPHRTSRWIFSREKLLLQTHSLALRRDGRSRRDDLACGACACRGACLTADPDDRRGHHAATGPFGVDRVSGECRKPPFLHAAFTDIRRIDQHERDDFRYQRVREYNEYFYVRQSKCWRNAGCHDGRVCLHQSGSGNRHQCQLLQSVDGPVLKQQTWFQDAPPVERRSGVFSYERRIRL